MKKSTLVFGIVITAILTILLTFVIAGTLKGGKSSKGVYIAAWLPVLLVYAKNRNKARNKNLTKNQKMLVIGALILTLVLVLATILYS